MKLSRITTLFVCIAVLLAAYGVGLGVRKIRFAGVETQASTVAKEEVAQDPEEAVVKAETPARPAEKAVSGPVTEDAFAQLGAELGVETPPGMQDNLMEYWNALSDEEKAQAQEEWGRMSDEQRKQALGSWEGRPAETAVSGLVTKDTFTQLGAGLGVEIPPGMQDNLMEYWNALSDEEKAQVQEEWGRMSDEQRKQALESWKGLDNEN